MPKNVYYYFKANWREEAPVVHIAVRDWPVRTEIDRRGTPKTCVRIFVNTDEVELIADGRSLGRKRPSNYSVTFDIPANGVATNLIARGSFKGKETEDMAILRTNLIKRIIDPSSDIDIAINAGSDCFYMETGTDHEFPPDMPYENGSWGYVGGEADFTRTQIETTNDCPLYQTCRNGEFSYRFDVPKGRYELEISYSDIYKNSATLVNLLDNGSRRDDVSNAFSISVNRQPLEKELHTSAGEHFMAKTTRYVIVSDKDHIQVDFKPVSGKAIVSAIRLRKI